MRFEMGYDSGVWFGNTKLPFSTSICIHESVQNQSQPVREVLLSKLFVRFGARMLLALCVLLSEWCVQFGAGMLVPCRWSAAARCWYRVLLAFTVLRAMWSGYAGAAAEGCCRCCLRVLLSKWYVCALNNALERACWWAGAGRRCCLRVLSS